MKKATNIIEVYEVCKKTSPLNGYNQDYLLYSYKKSLTKLVASFEKKTIKDLFILGEGSSGKTSYQNMIKFYLEKSSKIISIDIGDYGDYYAESLAKEKDFDLSSILLLCIANKLLEIWPNKIYEKEVNPIIFLKKTTYFQYKLINNIINDSNIFIFIDSINLFINIKNDLSILNKLVNLKMINANFIINLPLISKPFINNTQFDIIELNLTKNDLEEIIYTRIDSNIITQRALDLAIRYCNKNINKLISTIFEASIIALENNTSTIETYEVQRVINPLKEKIKKDNIQISKNKYINSIQIKDYFSIKNTKLENLEDKKEIYFVGENGDGKTIVLQALALLFKNNSNLTILADKYIDNIKDDYVLNILEEDSYINDNLFAYGINRNKIDADNKDKSGYSGLFDTPSLQNTTFLNRPQELFLLNNSITDEFINKIENLLENKIQIANIASQIFFYESNKQIEFKMLSEGYKSTIIWLSDLVFRLIEKQPKITKLEDFKAVVLVDEIDLYLHPKWKYSFVYKLRKIFPKIQFIMTTHSMTTILGASKDAVFYNIYKDKEGHTQLSEQFDDISDYSANILITSRLFNMDSAKARSYDDKVNNLSEDDFKKHQLNKKIDKMLEEDDDISAKEAILKQLEEYNERN